MKKLNAKKKNNDVTRENNKNEKYAKKRNSYDSCERKEKENFASGNKSEVFYIEFTKTFLR